MTELVGEDAKFIMAVVGRDGFFITEDGRLWSTSNGRYLLGSRAGRLGYRKFRFSDGKSIYIHRMSCEAWHGPPPSPKHQVRHLDGNIDNNAPSNLGWGTNAENQADRFLHGTDGRGERNPMAKLNEVSVAAIRARREKYGTPYHALAKEYGVSTMTIQRAVTGQTWVQGDLA